METERSGQSKNLYSHTNTWFRTELVCSHGFSVTDIQATTVVTCLIFVLF